MIVIDSSALIAILRREPEADDFLQIIASSDGCFLSSVSLLEASMVLAGRSGDVGSWMSLDALIVRAAIQVVAQDAGLAGSARRASILYGKVRHPAGLNLGDCASYALAKESSLPILFRRNDFSETDLVAAARYFCLQTLPKTSEVG